MDNKALSSKGSSGQESPSYERNDSFENYGKNDSQRAGTENRNYLEVEEAEQEAQGETQEIGISQDIGQLKDLVIGLFTSL
jgi:hypothetical protein